MKRYVLVIIAIAMMFSLSTASAQAALLFSDDFESPDVTAAQSTGSTSMAIPNGWVGATNGYRANWRGVIDESAGAFTDPVGEQAFAFRYTNSGLTSASGEIGTLTLGLGYSVSFDAVRDDTATPYVGGLVLFDGAGDRTNVNGGITNGTFAVLTNFSGNANSDGSYTGVNFTYAPTTSTPAAQFGKDIAIRFDGATTSANIDNVSISSTPILIATPASGSTIEFLDVPAMEMDSFAASLMNNWISDVTIDSINFSGSDPASFSVTDLMVSDIISAGDTAPYSINFLGGPADETFSSTLTIGTNFGDVVYDLSATTAAVPEPASIAIWTLLGLALGGYGYHRARRQR